MERKEENEVQIGKTVYKVKRVFTGEQTLGKIMTEWAIQRTLEDMKKANAPREKVCGLVGLH